jgi:hypothetical protein
MKVFGSQLLFTVAVTIAVSLPTASTGFQFPSFFSAAPKQQQNEKGKAIIRAQELLHDLEGLIGQAPRNGIDTPSELEAEILETLRQLEPLNPTPKPVRNTELMNGFWKMRWTNFSPAAPSSGKLGPFVGDVYQDIVIPDNASNILKVAFPSLAGALKASIGVENDSTVSITFISVANKLLDYLTPGISIG